MAENWRRPWIDMIWLACTSLTVPRINMKEKVQPQTRSTTRWTRNSTVVLTSVSHLSTNSLLLLWRNWELIDSNIHFSPGIRTTAKPLKSYRLWLQEPGPTGLIYSELEHPLLSCSQRGGGTDPGVFILTVISGGYMQFVLVSFSYLQFSDRVLKLRLVPASIRCDPAPPDLYWRIETWTLPHICHMSIHESLEPFWVKSI